jgi:hypothetical protein
MQNLVVGMWSKRKQSFTSPRVGSCPAMRQQATWNCIPNEKGRAEAAKPITPPASRSGPTAAYRYRSIQKHVQDGSVWLTIGKPRLRRQDEASFGPISDVAPSFDPGKHEGLLASLFCIVPAYPHIR